MAFPGKPKPLEYLGGSVIARVNVGLKTIEIQRMEGVIQERPQCLAHIA